MHEQRRRRHVEVLAAVETRRPEGLQARPRRARDARARGPAETKASKNTLTYHTTLPLLLQRLPERVIWRVALLTKRVLVRVRDHVALHLEEALLLRGRGLQALELQL